MYFVLNLVNKKSITLNNEEIAIEDLCYRPIKGKGCYRPSNFCFISRPFGFVENGPRRSAKGRINPVHFDVHLIKKLEKSYSLFRLKLNTDHQGNHIRGDHLRPHQRLNFQHHHSLRPLLDRGQNPISHIPAQQR